MFPVKRSVEEVIDTSLYGRTEKAAMLVLAYALVYFFGIPELIDYVEQIDAIIKLDDTLPVSFGSIFFFLVLVSSTSLALPTYRLMLLKEIDTPNPFISWARP